MEEEANNNNKGDILVRGIRKAWIKPKSSKERARRHARRHALPSTPLERRINTEVQARLAARVTQRYGETTTSASYRSRRLYHKRIIEGEVRSEFKYAKEMNNKSNEQLPQPPVGSGGAPVRGGGHEDEDVLRSLVPMLRASINTSHNNSLTLQTLGNSTAYFQGRVEQEDQVLLTPSRRLAAMRGAASPSVYASPSAHASPSVYASPSVHASLSVHGNPSFDPHEQVMDPQYQHPSENMQFRRPWENNTQFRQASPAVNQQRNPVSRPSANAYNPAVNPHQQNLVHPYQQTSEVARPLRARSVNAQPQSIEGLPQQPIEGRPFLDLSTASPRSQKML